MPRHPSRPPRVLVAGVDPAAQGRVADLLGRGGHEVVEAGTGGDVLAGLERGPFGLVLLGTHLPDMTALRAVRLVRAREKATGGRVPVAVLGGGGHPDERGQCLAAGADEYLAGEGELSAAVGRLAGGGRPGVPAWAEAMGDVGFDEETIREVAGLFAQTAAPRLGELRQALGAGDAQGVSRAAHALKSAASALYAPAVTDAAGVLEQRAREGNLEGAAELAGVLEEEVKRLSEEAGEYLGGPP
jgi:HPt (histidine-containing phosphotransfer) domain-containing protein